MAPRKNNLTFGKKAVRLLRDHREKLSKNKKRPVTFGQTLEDIMIKAGLLEHPLTKKEDSNTKEENDPDTNDKDYITVSLCPRLKGVLSGLKKSISDDLGRTVTLNETVEHVLRMAGVMINDQ